MGKTRHIKGAFKPQLMRREKERLDTIFDTLPKVDKANDFFHTHCDTNHPILTIYPTVQTQNLPEEERRYGYAASSGTIDGLFRAISEVIYCELYDVYESRPDGRERAQWALNDFISIIEDRLDDDLGECDIDKLFIGFEKQTEIAMKYYPDDYDKALDIWTAHYRDGEDIDKDTLDSLNTIAVIAAGNFCSRKFKSNEHSVDNDIESISKALEKSKSEVDSLNCTIKNLKEKHTSELASKDKQIKALTKELRTVEHRLKEMEERRLLPFEDDPTGGYAE